MKNQEETFTNAVRIWDIIPEYVRFEESDQFPLYELISETEGIVRENPGRKKQESILFYNVTNASDEFKASHADSIHELIVKKVEKITKVKAKETPRGKIQLVLPFASLSSLTLTKEEKFALGSDIYKLINTEEGIKLTAVYMNKGPLPEDLYLRILPDKISPELYEKIAEISEELLEQENGLYKAASSLEKDKQI